MADMLNVYDLATRRKTAVLQNAFNIVETHELNKIYSLTFQIPADEEKVQYCLPRHFVRWGDKGQLYRIVKPTKNESDTSVIQYECEHVIATLCDKCMFGSFTVGGYEMKTADVIRWLLSQQEVKNWELGECNFDRRFEYLWEQENILNALYSIPKEFSLPYQWTFDTTVYPWKLNLKQIDDSIHPEYYLRAKRNLLASGTTENYADICTRIYPLGYGEGVNQLTIKDVNGGVPYLQSPDNIVAQYGIVEKVLVDRRFENADSLKAYAQTMLDGLQTPSMSKSFDVVDLYPLTNDDFDNAEVGKIVKLVEDDTIAYITKTRRRVDSAGDLQIDLSTKTTDIVSSIADLADRVRIESVYAQGATQLYQHSKDENATPEKGMLLHLYFPEEMRQINKVLLKMSLNRFRSYSNTTSIAESQVRTSTEGGESKQTSSSGGSSTPTTSSGGGSTYTSSSGGSSTPTTSSGGGSTYTSSSGGGSTCTSSSGGGTGSTSTGASSISASVTSGASSKKTSDGGGLGSDIETSSSTVPGKTASIPVTVNAGGAVTNQLTTKTLDFTLKTTGASSSTAYTSYNTFSINSSSDYYSGNTYGAKASIWADSAGDHSHNIWGFTGETTPPASASYRHSHGINYSGGALPAGGHSHNLGQNDHSHYLYHNHSIKLSGVGNHRHSVTVPEHTHDVKISGHTHTISIPAHTHTTINHFHYLSDTDHKHSISKASFNHSHGMDHTHTINLSGVGSHSHTFSIGSHSHTVTIPNHSHTVQIPNHSHTVTIPAHTHTVNIPNHSHTVTIPAHTHTVNIPKHTHEITIPAHSHQIIAGIFESGNATGFDIYVNNKKKQTIAAKNWEGDITQWLLNDKNQVPRDSWIDVEIRPNDLAYVVSSVFVQGFVQSRGGGNY